jgi:hypothetical protein
VTLSKAGKAGRKEAERRFAKLDTAAERPKPKPEHGTRDGSDGMADIRRRFPQADV